MDFGKTLVIQASPGIGDMIWHLPYLRALAKHTRNNKLSLLTKSRNLTKQWLAHDPLIDTIYYAERQGLFSQVNQIKGQNFETVWVLHRSFSYALVAALAGIKNRYGFGYGAQKYLLTNPSSLTPPMRHWHTIDQVRTLLEGSSIDVDPHDQTIFLPGDVSAQARQYIPNTGGPSLVLGIGGSGEDKRWSLDSFVKLGLALNAQGYKNIFVCGGPGEDKEAAYIVEEILHQKGTATKMTTLPIDQSIAFMGMCDVYIGNDSGMLNAAVCRGTPALGLFGPTPALTYSPLIYALKENTMADISVEQVMALLTQNNLLNRDAAKAAV